MPKHQLLRQVKAKSLSVKVPKNEPNTARLSWVLANEEFQRSKSLAMLWNASWFKRNAPSKKHHYLSGAFERVAVMLSVTKSHKTGKWPTNHLQGTSSRRSISTRQFARWERGNEAAGGIWYAIVAGSSRCSAVRQ